MYKIESNALFLAGTQFKPHCSFSQSPIAHSTSDNRKDSSSLVHYKTISQSMGHYILLQTLYSFPIDYIPKTCFLMKRRTSYKSWPVLGRGEKKPDGVGYLEVHSLDRIRTAVLIWRIAFPEKYTWLTIPGYRLITKSKQPLRVETIKSNGGSTSTSPSNHQMEPARCIAELMASGSVMH